MYEIDKEAFGKFLAQQRKAKGYTQKALAEKLFVSDKAVSKWERSLSMPDISLLIPLSEILEVSVTELLEGRLFPEETHMEPDQVELLVKKALTFSFRGNSGKNQSAEKEICPSFWRKLSLGLAGIICRLLVFSRKFLTGFTYI